MSKLALEADGNVVGESFIIQSDKNTASKLGILFGVIEAYNINDNFLDGLLNAVNDLKTEFYLPPHNIERGVEKRFEEAISRANRRILASINQSVEEIDLRNISAAIGLWHDNQVYLSSVGRVKALFFRRKKNQEILIIDILSGNGEIRYRPEPEKVFANILSGELSAHDGLALLNEEFLGFFSQKELGEIVLSHSANDSTKTLTESLQEKIVKKNFYAVILAPEVEAVTALPAEKPQPQIHQPVATPSYQAPEPQESNAKPISGQVPPELITPRQIKQVVPTQHSIDQLLITQVRTEKYLTPSLLPPWKKLLVVIWTTIKKYAKLSGKKLKKLATLGLTAINNKIKSQKNKTPISVSAPENTVPEFAEAEPETALPIDTDVVMTETLSDEVWPQSEPLEIDNIEAEPFRAPELLVEEIKVAETKKPGKLTEKINQLLNSQIVKFLNLKKSQQIILILGLILIFLFSQSVVMIGRSSDKSQGTTDNTDLTKQIETQLNSAEAQNIFNDEIGAITSLRKARELYAQIPDKRLNKATREELQAKIDKTAGILQKIKRLDKLTALANLDLGQATDLTGLARTGKVFWTFDNLNRNLVRFDTATGNLTTITTTLATVKLLSAIDDKSLITTGSSGIYKYDIAKRTSTKTKSSKDYFQIKLPLTQSPLIDPPLASSTIAMSVTSDIYSYYLDGINGRIIIVDKNGILKRQYYSNALTSANSFSVSTKDKKIWFYNSSKIYQIDMDF